MPVFEILQPCSSGEPSLAAGNPFVESVVVPEPAGVEMRVNFCPAERPSSSRSIRRLRTTTLGGGGGM